MVFIQILMTLIVGAEEQNYMFEQAKGRMRKSR